MWTSVILTLDWIQIQLGCRLVSKWPCEERESAALVTHTQKKRGAHSSRQAEFGMLACKGLMESDEETKVDGQVPQHLTLEQF